MTTEEKQILADLKKRRIKAGISIKAVVDEVNWPYPTVFSQLSGYSPLTPTVKRATEKLIASISKKRCNRERTQSV